MAGRRATRRRAGRAGRPRGRGPRGHARLRVVRQRPPRRQPGHGRRLQPVLDRRAAARARCWATCGGWSTRSTTSPGSCRGGRARDRARPVVAPRTAARDLRLDVAGLARRAAAALDRVVVGRVHRGHGRRCVGRRPGLGPPARGVRRGLRAARPREPDRLDRPAAPPAQPAGGARFPDPRRASGRGARGPGGDGAVRRGVLHAVVGGLPRGPLARWLHRVQHARPGVARRDRGDRVDRGRPSWPGWWRASRRRSGCGWPRRARRWPPGTPRPTRSGRC